MATLVPMPILFRTCADILAESFQPWHYGMLTEAALERLGTRFEGKALAKAKEDVREKMLLARQFGSAYTGPPHYLAVLEHWFPSEQPPLLNPEVKLIQIEGSAACGEEACFEALMRYDHMQIKTPAAKERIMRGRARGLVTEQHISQWFRDRFPDMWEPADQHGQWASWCDHDFKLELRGKTWRVDVMGPHLDGEYGTPKGGGKRPTDIHILGRIEGRHVLVEGFISGKHLREHFAPEQTHPISWLLVRLACIGHGFSYWDLARSISRAAAGRKAA